MNKKELRAHIEELKSQLEIQKKIGEKYNSLEENNKEMYSHLEARKDELYNQSILLNDELSKYKRNMITVSNDFSDIFYEKDFNLNTFIKVQNICIEAIAGNEDLVKSSPDFACFFSYIHNLLSKEYDEGFKEIEKKYRA